MSRDWRKPLISELKRLESYSIATTTTSQNSSFLNCNSQRGKNTNTKCVYWKQAIVTCKYWGEWKALVQSETTFNTSTRLHIPLPFPHRVTLQVALYICQLMTLITRSGKEYELGGKKRKEKTTPLPAGKLWRRDNLAQVPRSDTSHSFWITGNEALCLSWSISVTADIPLTLPLCLYDTRHSTEITKAGRGSWRRMLQKCQIMTATHRTQFWRKCWRIDRAWTAQWRMPGWPFQYIILSTLLSTIVMGWKMSIPQFSMSVCASDPNKAFAFHCFTNHS